MHKRKTRRLYRGPTGLRNHCSWVAPTGILFLFAAAVSAQDPDLERRLTGGLSEAERAAIDAHIEEATAGGLPEAPLRDLALQGAAKGRNGAEVLRAIDALTEGLGRARAALQDGGRTPTLPETEAAELAMRMGADAEAVRELARSGPAGRSLAVPLVVLGGLTQRGLPSDQAVGRVIERLAARLDDEALLADAPGLAGAVVRRGPPVDVLGRGRAGGAPGHQGSLPAQAGPAGGVRPSGTPTPPDAPGGPGGPPGRPGGPGPS